MGVIQAAAAAPPPIEFIIGILHALAGVGAGAEDFELAIFGMNTTGMNEL